MSLTPQKTDNELILRRRKKKRVKKIFMLFILLISVCVTLCFKLPYFNIKTIQVTGNKNISSEKIVELSKIYKGNNIFYVNTNNSKTSILSNPYIYAVEINKKLPDSVKINVKEREAVFYNVIDKKYFVVDKNGIVLQKRDDIKDMKLVKLDGFDYAKCEIGKSLANDDKRKIDALTSLADVILNSKIAVGIVSIDVSNSIDIKAYYGDVYIKLGSADNIDKKINKALNILNRKELKGAKGYIDVSFDGNPVFFIQK